MKGSSEIHTTNKKFREGFDGIKKACGCPFGEKCGCKIELALRIIDNAYNEYCGPEEEDGEWAEGWSGRSGQQK